MLSIDGDALIDILAAIDLFSGRTLRELGLFKAVSADAASSATSAAVVRPSATFSSSAGGNAL
jgi:hypothetical protein